MNALNYSIADEVFIRFPDYVRGVVLAYDVKNGESSCRNGDVHEYVDKAV